MVALIWRELCRTARDRSHDSAVDGSIWIEATRKRRCSSFYFPKDTFDSIPISMWKRLKSVAVLIEEVHRVISVIDEKFGIIEPIVSMKLG
jgi:hypothetical protein